MEQLNPTTLGKVLRKMVGMVGTLVMAALGRQRQEDSHKFKASLVCNSDCYPVYTSTPSINFKKFAFLVLRQGLSM